ncbi:uncharacterized protein MKZ38_009008 [Zalerion maritima]|uniref:Uncharacterized protein n=1 Tax=Zalerion maritima TaxID=339359 RepID=A0AAD5RGV7_9PEZI|nr:uncharacterized protein MKZ38_009008 [Zalerion maritima]
MLSSGPPRQAQSTRRPNPASATTTVSISASAAAAMSTSYSPPIDQSKTNNKNNHHPLPSLTPYHRPSSSPDQHRPDSKSRRPSLPFSFPPLFHNNHTTSTSASLVPSTAQGRPIPLDQETTSHRTSALRELNSTYPSKHRYAKSTGAQSTTYSQPVIVRTYSGPPSRPASASRGGRRSSTASRLKYPFSSASTTQSTPVVRNVGPGLLSGSMVRAKHLAQGKKRPGRNDEQPARLPPVDAFSFKSFMADASMQQDISTDLDRIAEICARSRYSLSNQYEVHMSPHGSGAAFVAGSTPSRGGLGAVGPTLQAVSSDDERGHRKRRSAGRRRSAAYGTLETIMSSSRSSEEDKKQKKKGAAEIADEVRGRAARKEPAPAPVSSKSPKKTRVRQQGTVAPCTDGDDSRKLGRKKSTSFATAIIDSSRYQAPPVPQVPSDLAQDIPSPRNSTAALHSDPALPQTSSSHLEIRTTPEANGGATYVHESRPQSPAGSDGIYDPLSITMDDEPRNAHGAGIVSNLGSWIPWGGVGRTIHGGRRNGAEGSLRELLKTSDSKPSKGKALDRTRHY